MCKIFKIQIICVECIIFKIRIICVERIIFKIGKICVERIIFKIGIICGISFNNFTSSFDLSTCPIGKQIIQDSNNLRNISQYRELFFGLST